MPGSAQQPTVVILAAGLGRRFRESGGDCHKLSLQLEGLSILEHVIRAVQASGLPFEVVRQADGPGMGDSIATGVRRTPQAHGWLILPGDLPLIRASSILQVAEQLRQGTHAVVLPLHAGQRGHPVGFSRDCQAQLLALQGEPGAAAIVRSRQALGQVCRLELVDPGMVLDVDTLEDFRRLQVMWPHSETHQERNGHGKH